MEPSRALRVAPRCGGAGGTTKVGRSEWWALRDLNPQPRDYESPALTIELKARLKQGSHLWARRKAGD
jgi:hypothetical protein